LAEYATSAGYRGAAVREAGRWFALMAQTPHRRMSAGVPPPGGVMLNGRLRFACLAALALAVHLIGATASVAQQWPTRPVRFVLPFGPGSGADTGARLITEKLQQKWGQPVVIDGKPGGDGLLSLGAVVSAKDDHTFFFG